MTTYSDAAAAYAHKFGPDAQWRIAIAAFDAGLAARPSPEPITTAAQLNALGNRFPPPYLRTGAGGAVTGNRYGWFVTGTETVYTSGELVRSFAPLTLLVPASAPAEPERLTDPDDPRIRDGAIVSVCFLGRKGPESVTYVYLLDDNDPLVKKPSYIRGNLAAGITRLIAEAPEPDPDAELIPAITRAAVTGAHKYAVGLPTWDDLDSSDLLRDFRAVDLDVVRTVKP